MKYETNIIRKNMCYNGVVLLRCELCYPRIGASESFFEELCERCLIWAKEQLFVSLCEEYTLDKDPKKRFSKGYEYRAFIKAEETHVGYVKCAFSAYFKKIGAYDRTVLCGGDFFVRLSDGCLVPPHYIDKMKKQKEIKPRDRKGKNIDK